MRKTLSLILLAFIILLVPFNTVSADIESESEYITNLESKEADELFDLKIGDVNNPFTWLKERDTFSVLEVDSSGNDVYWFNVPNLQSIIYNQALEVLPSGYMGSGMYPYKKGGIVLVDIPKPEKANTAMQRYGFDIPSPAYLGEYPKITMSVMGVLIESNPVKFVANKIKGIFGGNIISAPDASTYNTLQYMSPSDYKATNNTFEKWAGLYWNDVVDHMKDGQVLISGADDDGYKDDIQFVKDTIIVQNDIETIEKGGERKLNNKLKDLLGTDYQDVMTNIVAFGVDEGKAKSFDQAPVRIMPYNKITLTDIDAKHLAADPRSDSQTAISIFGLSIPLGLDNIILNNIASFFISIGGSVSELSVFLNGITTFSTIEGIGFDIVELWKSPIMTILAAMIMIVMLVMLVGHTIRILKGEGSIGKVLVDSLMSFLILGLIFSMSITPDKTYSTVKSISTTIMNFGSQTLMFNDTGKELMGSGDASEKADTSYWIPYFSLWTAYNTGNTLDSKELKINKDNIDNEPEQQNMPVPKLSGDTEIKLWSAKLAESFTSGSSIDKSSYRVIDHLMAPRLTVGEPPKLYTTKMNENFNKPVQSSIDIGLFMLIFVLFIGVIVKVILFLEALYFLAMAPVNLALSTYNKERVSRTGKELLAAFVRVGLWDIAMAMIIFMSMISSGIVTLILSFALMYGFYKGLIALSSSNSVMVPNSLKIARRYI